jgi:hypothetical protein
MSGEKEETLLATLTSTVIKEEKTDIKTSQESQTQSQANLLLAVSTLEKKPPGVLKNICSQIDEN